MWGKHALIFPLRAESDSSHKGNTEGQISRWAFEQLNVQHPHRCIIKLAEGLVSDNFLRRAWSVQPSACQERDLVTHEKSMVGHLRSQQDAITLLRQGADGV